MTRTKAADPADTTPTPGAPHQRIRTGAPQPQGSLLQMYVDYASDGMFVVGPGNVVVDVNRQACESLGYTRDELIGMTPYDFDVLFAADEAFVRRIMGRQQAAEAFTFETVHRRKDGTVFPVEIRSRPFAHAGEQYSLALVRDITERKRADEELRAAAARLDELRAVETRFRTYVDHATDALFVHDAEGRLIDVNRTACDSLGYTREEMIGKVPGDFDPARARETNFLSGLHNRLDHDEVVTFETAHLRKDGTTFPVEVRIRPFWYGGRRFALAVARDIRERRRVEEERDRLRQLEIERETAIADERRRLAGEIHDTLAQGLAMIVMQLADAEAKLGPAWSLAQKPLTTVRELAVESLAYARRSVNALRPGAPAGGVPRAIRDVIDSARRYFAGTMTLTVRGTPVMLNATVESAFVSIAREALTNAARHSGGTSVTADLEFMEAGGVRLAVADNGVGFDAAIVRPDAYGLTGMQERAARAGVALTFVTEPGAGTEVVAIWSPPA